MNRIVLVIALSLAAGSVAAGEMNATLVGLVSGQGRGADRVEGAKLAVVPDKLWGRGNPDAYERYKLEQGALPEIKVTGEGVSDKSGKVEFKVKVTWDDSETMPAVTVRQRDGSETQVVYA
jgi:hypothetical protein